MDHERLKKNLFALYDGELSATECHQVLAHIENCPECRQTYTNWEKIAKTFFRPFPTQTSEVFVQKVMERVETLTEPDWARWRPVAIRWLAPVLGLGISALLLFISLPNQEPAISTEALLLTNGPERIPSQWVFLRESPQADDLLVIVLEEP